MESFKRSLILNANCFAHPGDQNPGDAPGYFSKIHADGIRNMDVSLRRPFPVHVSIPAERDP